MSFFGPMLRRKTVDASSLTWDALGLQPAKSGVSVTVNSALGVATVLACCRVIAEGIAQLPSRLMQEKEDGSKTIAKGHPLHRIISRRPNSWQTWFEFCETLGYHALLCKGGFAYIARVGGNVEELIPLLPERVTVRKPITMAGEVGYSVALSSGQAILLRSSEVLRVRGPSWDGYTGMEAVQLAREAIGLTIATETSQAKLHANGGRPGGILTADGQLKKETRDRLKAEFDKDSDTAKWRLMVLDSGLKYQAMSMTGVDAQHIETRKHQVEEICRAFRVFPQMVGYSDKTSTYASAEQFFLAHVVHSLGPWIERWEQALSRDLLSEEEQVAGFYPMLDPRGLMRGDSKSRAEYYKAALGTASSPGWMSPNDVRRLEDLDPGDGLDEVISAADMSGKGGAAPSGDQGQPAKEPTP
jgi:HK97 family phage portal protein